MLVNAGRPPNWRIDCSSTAGIDWNSSTSISAGTPAGYCASHGRSIVMRSPPRDVRAGILGDTDQYGLEHRVQGLARRAARRRRRCTGADGRTVACMESPRGTRRDKPTPQRRAARAACTWAGVALLLALSPSCSRSDPEAALRARLESLAAAIEARD